MCETKSESRVYIEVGKGVILLMSSPFDFMTEFLIVAELVCRRIAYPLLDSMVHPSITMVSLSSP